MVFLWFVPPFYGVFHLCTSSLRPIRDAIEFPSQRHGATPLAIALRHAARVDEGHGIGADGGVEDQKMLGAAWQAIELA